jgi:pyruvate dehydrogenase complex dehydrogenase (E1) component
VSKRILVGGHQEEKQLQAKVSLLQDDKVIYLQYHSTIKTLRSAFLFAYEFAVIIRDGIYRMYEKQEDVFYYLTVMNENYIMPNMPKETAKRRDLKRYL